MSYSLPVCLCTHELIFRYPIAGLFLSRWLDTLSASGDATWTRDERSLVALVQETLGEVDLDQTRASKAPSAQIMYAWTAIYGSEGTWGVVSTINSLVTSFVDSIAS